MAVQLNPEWAGGHGGAEETAGVMAVDPSLIKHEYIGLDEGIKNDVSDELPSGAWTNVVFKGANVTIPREIKDITDHGWLAHSFKNDQPTRANEQWGTEMLETVAKYIAEFGEVFGKTELPPVIE